MIETTLPIHLVTGVRAIGWRNARRGETGPQPIWPIRGGSGADEDDSADGGEPKDEDGDDDAADDQGDDTDNTEQGDEDKPLGPAGEKALKAMKERLAAAEEMLTAAGITSKTQARRVARDRAKAKETKTAPKPADNGKPADEAEKPDPEKIRAEVRAELEAAALRERVLDKIEVKAAKGFADPTDAVAVIMRGHEIDDFLDDGKLDVEAIQDALDELLKKKPYLAAVAAQGGSKRFQGSAEGGAKSQKPARPKSLDEAVQRHFAS